MHKNIRLLLALIFIICSANSKSYSQQSCVAVDYEDVVCNNEPIQFILKNNGFCVINNIEWIFNNTINEVDTMMGPGPHQITFVEPGFTNFSIGYYDDEQKVQVFKEKSFEVIEPVVDLIIEPPNPCVGQIIKLKANGPKEGYFVWNSAIEQKGERLFEVMDTVREDNQINSLGWFLGSNNTSRGCRFRVFTDTIKTVKMPPLIISPSNNINICEGEEVKLQIKNPNSNSRYIWKSENLIVDNTSLNIKPDKSTNITVSSVENGCLKSEDITISLTAVPSFIIKPATATICKGSSLALNIVTENFENDINYTWSGGLTTALSELKDTVIITPASSATYTATWEYEGCKATANTTINTTENTTSVIGNRTVNICSGEEVKLSVNVPTTGTIKWSEKEFPNSIEAPSITVSPEKTTVYEVNWTDGLCSDSGTITVNVTAKPNLIIGSAIGSSFCKGDVIDLKVSFTNGAFNNNFSWSIADEQKALNIDTNTLSFIAVESSYVTAIWLDSHDLCKEVVTEKFQFEVKTKPESITLKANKEKLCEGETVKLTVGGANIENFTLYDADSGQQINKQFESSSVDIAPSKTTNYIAWWLNDECRILSDTVKVVVNEIPSITVNNNEKICPNSHFEINIQPTEYSLYLWSGGDIPEADLIAGSKLSRAVNETDLVYSLRISENDCILDTLITLDVVNLDVKAVSDKPNNEACEDEPVQLTVSGADSYEWEENDIIKGNLSKNPVAYPTENLTQLTVNAFKDGCPANDVIELYLKEKPEAIIPKQNITICYGDTVQLDGNGGQNYLWQPNLFLNNGNNRIKNPVSTPNESILYTLTVIAENGCTDEATIAINVQNDGCEIDLNKIFVPNTITPNRDGINDNWEIPAIADLQDYSVTIFTDHGAIVFDKIGYQNEFNGIAKINGYFKNELPTGTYYYVIQHINSDSKRTGTITIIR